MSNIIESSTEDSSQCLGNLNYELSTYSNFNISQNENFSLFPNEYIEKNKNNNVELPENDNTIQFLNEDLFSHVFQNIKVVNEVSKTNISLSGDISFIDENLVHNLILEMTEENLKNKFIENKVKAIVDLNKSIDSCKSKEEIKSLEIQLDIVLEQVQKSPHKKEIAAKTREYYVNGVNKLFPNLNKKVGLEIGD